MASRGQRANKVRYIGGLSCPTARLQCSRCDPAGLCSAEPRSTWGGVPQGTTNGDGARTGALMAAGSRVTGPVNITAKVPLAAQPRHLCERPANHFECRARPLGRSERVAHSGLRRGYSAPRNTSCERAQLGMLGVAAQHDQSPGEPASSRPRRVRTRPCHIACGRSMASAMPGATITPTVTPLSGGHSRAAILECVLLALNT